MKTTTIGPRAPTGSMNVEGPATAARPTPPPETAAAARARDEWLEHGLGAVRPDDQRAELRSFAPVAAKLARARAASDVRPVFVEALELHLLASRLASYAFRGGGPVRFDEAAAARELDAAERNPVTNVLAFLAGGKKVHHLSEKEIARVIGVETSSSPLDEAAAKYVTTQRAHLEGRSTYTPSSWPSARDQGARDRGARDQGARDQGPLASVLGVRIYMEGATSGPFRDTRSGVQKWIDEGPL